MKTDEQKNLSDIRNRNVAKLAGGINPSIVKHVRSLFLGGGFNREDILNIMNHSVGKREKEIKDNMPHLQKGNTMTRLMRKDAYENRMRELKKRKEMQEFVINCSPDIWNIVVAEYGDEINKE